MPLIIAALILASAAILLAMFPANWLKGTAETKLSDAIGLPVTIATMERESAFSFAPVIRLTDVSVPQARWAGSGKLASISLIRVRIHVLTALIGRFEPQVLSAKGVALDLVRDANKRTNWRKDTPDGERAAGNLSLADLNSVDAVVRYRDAFQKRSARMNLTIDPKRGLILSGTGEIDGNPVTLTAKGPMGKTGKPWPFEARIAGPAIDMRVTGAMAGLLQTDDMTMHATVRANDLKLADRVIEAGLFGTQPIDLVATVRHRERRWVIDGLTGRIGTSELSGKLVADKSGERTRLDGDVRFARLDFEDLATDAGNAAARALEQAEGKKFVPNTRINIGKIDSTDGRIAFRIDRIVSRTPSAIRSASGVLTIDNRLLIAKPFVLELSRGTIGGEVRVDQRKGQAEPTVTLALDLRGSSIDALAGGHGDIDATVDGRVHLVGVGSTVREAVGRSDGTIGLYAHDGSLPAKLATLLGFDVGKSLFTGKDRQASLRCGVVRLEMRRGIGTAAPLVVDTSESQTRGAGVVSFPGEQLALTLTGAPKRNSLLRLPGSILVRGTIREPSVVIPKEVKSLGNVMKALGRAIAGKQGPAAPEADCAALGARTLGN